MDWLKKLMPVILVDLFKKKTDHDNKISGIESKIPSISGLATTAALSAVENNIPDASDLEKKRTDYDAKKKKALRANKFTNDIFNEVIFNK